MLGFWAAMRPLVTPLVFFILGTVWVYQSGSDIINRDPRMYLFMIGAIFANVNVCIAQPSVLCLMNDDVEVIFIFRRFIVVKARVGLDK